MRRLAYRGIVDSAPTPRAGLSPSITSFESEDRLLAAERSQEPESQVAKLSGLKIEELWREAEANQVDLNTSELALALLAIGTKYNFGLAPGLHATRAQVTTFWRSLQLREIALTQACALGRDRAWRQFLDRYRDALTQIAIAITESTALGQELADSLYSEMFGLSGRDGHRRSPLASYAGRGSLLGFLRTTLAQRHVDQHRRRHRETQLDGRDFPAVIQAPSPGSDVLRCLSQSLTATMQTLDGEERFLLSAWYLDQRTLLEIAQVMRVHEATISRKLKRLTTKLRNELLKNLQTAGMDKHAAEDALGTDPRDLTINLRSLLQAPGPATFIQQRPESDG